MPNTKKYDSELMHLINQWNETEVAYSEDKTVIDLFEAQVDKTPDSVAVIFGEEELTYGELNRRANQVAHYLRSLGVKEETLVGISLNRSLELIVGILGILKAGGAYVPLDPEYPQERLQFMLDDTQAPVLITTREIQESKYTGDWEGQIVLMDDEETCNTLQEQSFHNPIPITTGENLAYVIYTSGSTGHPKGVMATHRAFINRCMWMWERYPFTREEKTCLKTSINFVDAVWEMFGGMLQGITLVVFPQEINKDIEKLLSLIDFYSITRLILVPSLFQAILDYLTQNDRKLISSLKVYTLSGEKLNPDIVLKAQKIINDGLLLNLYGSSEVSADVTYWDCLFSEYTCGESIPIGRPISNTKVYILDEYRNPVPIGAVGEIYIGGAGLARGYLNQAELTAERFIENPFVSEADREAGKNLRLYRTGDLGRYLFDGNIEYMGRIDEQVKIRGFRIELGEIEATLKRCAGIQESVVIAQEVDGSSGDKQLVGYLIPDDGLKEQLVVEGSFEGSRGDKIEIFGGEKYLEVIREIKERLGRSLPEYMVPGAYVFIERIPLTHNGKVDKRGLPKPDRGKMVEKQYVGPRDEVEQTLCEIWQEVLGLERVGIYDNFFELGGHSLFALKLFNHIQNLLPHYGLTLHHLYANPTIQKQRMILDPKSKHKSFIFPILLEPEDNQVPVFLVHPGGGIALEYLKLAKYIQKGLIYGINNPYFGTSDTFESIEQMAKYYINEIQKITPKGPYILAGYSFGGLVAYEISNQLIQMGFDIKKLILIDTHYCMFADVISFEDFYNDCEIDFFTISDNNTFINKELRKIRKLFYSYKPPRTPIVTTLIKARQPNFRKKPYEIESDANHWQKVISTPFKIYTIDAKHEELFNDKFINELAQILSLEFKTSS